MELVAVPHYRFGLESLWGTGQWPAVLESGLGKFSWYHISCEPRPRTT
jgi:hypothetical protein